MRLLSWNIHKGIGGRDRRYSLQRIIDCIDHERPDLVCLQEVDRLVGRSDFDDQPRLLGQSLNLQSTFQANVPVSNGTYGNLILSRWAVGSTHRISLKRGIRKSRGAQLIHVETPEGVLHLVNTHLGLDERERHWQIDFLLEHELFQSSSVIPTFIAGDFNDWRNTLAEQSLANHGFQQVTSPPSEYRSFPSWLPVGGLDKVFVRGEVTTERVKVVRTSLARAASDHLPIVVDFSLK
ncbi:MAG: endonuclease/exonuclease/phosphatase family protein [Planctomycetes bacterium]|nr:endonuclease/exonuclease/phosphatase family protein [Planctomycetota bacterium]MBL6911329.1 endonuclease/exonuclease/phosphatase family protein [Pirellulales bacterium]